MLPQSRRLVNIQTRLGHLWFRLPSLILVAILNIWIQYYIVLISIINTLHLLNKFKIKTTGKQTKCVLCSGHLGFRWPFWIYELNIIVLVSVIKTTPYLLNNVEIKMTRKHTKFVLYDGHLRFGLPSWI